MNLNGNKVPRKRRNIGEASISSTDLVNETQGAEATVSHDDSSAEVALDELKEQANSTKKVGLFGKSNKNSKAGEKKERPRKGDKEEKSKRESRPKRERPSKGARPTRPRRAEAATSEEGTNAVEDVMQDVLLASTNELPDLASEFELPSDSVVVNKYEFDNNITEHQIRHKRVKEVVETNTDNELVNSISSAGLDLNYLDDTDALVNLDNLVSEGDVDTSIFNQADEEEAFIDSLINGTAGDEDKKEDKQEEEEFNPIELTTTVGSYEIGGESFAGSVGTEEFGDLANIPTENVDVQSQDIPTEDAIDPLSELDPIDTDEPAYTPTPSNNPTVFEMLQDLHNDLDTLKQNKCMTEQDLRLELFDDHLGRIEKAGVYDFTLPIYKVYYKGYAIPMNQSFEYAIPDGAEVEVDFGLRAFIPAGHILSVGAISDLESKMHVKFEGKRYFNDSEAFAGIRLKVKSTSPLSYLPAKFPTFKGTVIRNEKAS